jgi:hypothetical protein
MQTIDVDDERFEWRVVEVPAATSLVHALLEDS